jgi:hypothetical protein
MPKHEAKILEKDVPMNLMYFVYAAPVAGVISVLVLFFSLGVSCAWMLVMIG